MTRDVSLDDAASVGHTRTVLQRLELEVSRRLDGILQGDHRGLVPGHGSEPGEARPYQAGDDVRRIDWNVTARTNSIHLRETIAERELETWLLVDRSASLAFGTANQEKADIVLAACAAVGVLTARGGNRLGALIMAEHLQTIPARQGRTHLLALLDRVRASSNISGPSNVNLGKSVDRLAAVSRRRGLTVIVSDFLDDPDSWRHELAALSMRHQVMCVEVLDPRELTLPDAGSLTLIDTETGRIKEVNTGSRRLRERYAAAAAEQRSAIAGAIRSAGAEHLQLRTDRDWLLDMARFVVARRRRMANVSAGGRRS